MQYTSTRNNKIRVTSKEAIYKGISDDGGLFVPCEFPQLDKNDFTLISKMPYRERAFYIMRQFLDDYDEEYLKSSINKAYSTGSRLNDFRSKKVAPLVKLNDNLHVLELFHGPTFAFKDIALQLLPHLLVGAIPDEDSEVVILTATSGDTGKAALEGFRDVERTHVVVFYPEDGVSPIQKQSMLTQSGENVHVIAVKGNFDNAQTGVKRIFANKELNKEFNDEDLYLSSANSINWGRLLPQIVYYISAYSDMLANGEIMDWEQINICVPTGNFGNILAAYYSMRMGLPIKKLLCASNQNKVLTDFVQTGIYDKRRVFKKTIAPSMDILVSSNLERLLYHVSDENVVTLRRQMQSLTHNGYYNVDSRILEKVHKTFYANCANDYNAMDAIRETFLEYNYLLDPHTAMGKYTYDQYVAQTNDTTPTILVSTADPYKFPKAVLESLVGKPGVENIDEYECMEKISELTGTEISGSLAKLKVKDILHRTSCRPLNMEDELKYIFL